MIFEIRKYTYNTFWALMDKQTRGFFCSKWKEPDHPLFSQVDFLHFNKTERTSKRDHTYGLQDQNDTVLGK